MGRGRAKAKQTKVARELKYHTPDTDFSALQAELAGQSSVLPSEDDDFIEGDDFAEDPYAKYYDEYDALDEDDAQSEPVDVEEAEKND